MSIKKSANKVSQKLFVYVKAFNAFPAFVDSHEVYYLYKCPFFLIDCHVKTACSYSQDVYIKWKYIGCESIAYTGCHVKASYVNNVIEMSMDIWNMKTRRWRKLNIYFLKVVCKPLKTISSKLSVGLPLFVPTMTRGKLLFNLFIQPFSHFLSFILTYITILYFLFDFSLKTPTCFYQLIFNRCYRLCKLSSAWNMSVFII